MALHPCGMHSTLGGDREFKAWWSGESEQTVRLLIMVMAHVI